MENGDVGGFVAVVIALDGFIRSRTELTLDEAVVGTAENIPDSVGRAKNAEIASAVVV